MMRSNPHMPLDHRKLLFRYRLSLGFFILGLIVSGLTAIPIEPETAILHHWFGIKQGTDPESQFFQTRAFITLVHFAVHEISSRFPFLGYATDWLAFGHFVIAGFFILPFLEPARYRGILYVGLAACAGVIVVALVAGPFRNIPFLWTLVDCSFGVFGAIPLVYCLHITRKING